MKLSVITPTAERPQFLEATHGLLKKQTYQNWEWLIYDTSLHPQKFLDPRITYFHDEGIVSIGEKRNRLIEAASGEAIVHFDDDDYYAPTYLERLSRELKQVCFCKLHAWFSYDRKTGQFFYWDTQEGGHTRYCLDAFSGSRIREIEFGPYLADHGEKLDAKGKSGYGFSFAYRHEVTKLCLFEDLDLAEDQYFYESAAKAGFEIKSSPDHKGEAIHIIHDANTSCEFPQYRIPRFMAENLFPEFFVYENRSSCW